MFAYKTAVAVKKLGFRNIKIYNGGIKDWKKSGHPVSTIEALPAYEGRLITAEELLKRIKAAEMQNCRDAQNRPLMTILDLRTENNLSTDKPVTIVKTQCRTIYCLLDDLRLPRIRQQIPKDGLVVTITETGNRDQFAMRYLSQFGYTNVVGLSFGMRGWIKADYPVESRIQSDRQ